MGVKNFCGKVGDCGVNRIALDGFSYLSTFMTSETPSHEAYMLSSLLLPLSPTVATVLVGLTICTVIIFLVSSSKEKAFKATLILVSLALVSGMHTSSRQSPGRYHFVPWLLFVSFLSIAYETTLQSLVVTPQMHSTELSFEAMVEQNFTFLSIHSDFIKSSASELNQWLNNENKLPGANQDDWRAYYKEFELGDRIEKANFSQNDGAMGLHLLRVNPRDKKVLIVHSENLFLMANVVNLLGHNVLVGKERFFDTPDFWEFDLERRCVQMETLERKKAAGTVYDFFRRTDFFRDRETMRQFKMPEAKANTSVASSAEYETSTDFSDSVVGETFITFLYGIALSVFGSLLELASNRNVDICGQSSKVLPFKI